MVHTGGILETLIFWGGWGGGVVTPSDARPINWSVTLGFIHTCDLLGVNYCVNLSLRNGLYCSNLSGKIHTCDCVNNWVN